MLLDTYALVELFQGTAKGKLIEEMLAKKGENYCSIISIAEISRWCWKNSASPAKYMALTKELCALLDVDEELLAEAGRMRALDKIGMGMIDCIIYATAQKHGLVVLTGDPHFRGLKDVEFLE